MRRKILTISSLILVFLMTFQVNCADHLLQLTGKVTTIGHVPFVKTVIQSVGEPRTFYIIQGDMLPELKNLQGATLKVRGKVSGTDPEYQAKTLDVINYQVLAIGEGQNAKKPWVGILNSQNSLYLQTESGKPILLKGPLVTTLRQYDGAKLWLSGASRSS
ncbi:MAG TPA: hypothetical protein VEC37_13220, partial [Bacillota bacterium]|nr:hypothetical protein [Bacillota bacterium]